MLHQQFLHRNSQLVCFKVSFAGPEVGQTKRHCGHSRSRFARLHTSMGQQQRLGTMPTGTLARGDIYIFPLLCGNSIATLTPAQTAAGYTSN